MSLEGRIIGVIEDDPLMGESLLQSLSLEGATVEWWQTGHEAIQGLKGANADLIICDIRLPDTDGVLLYRKATQQGPAPPFIFMTAFGNIDQAVQLMRAGAEDYITKPFEISELLQRIHTIVPGATQSGLRPTLGTSAPMQQIEHALEAYAKTSRPLLVTGEIGVGKEFCARLLHLQGTSRSGPFISVNCPIMPQDLLETELFGPLPSTRAPAGPEATYFDRAIGGTLFIDGLARLSDKLQSRLVELIEKRKSSSLSSSSGNHEVRFPRIVCTTRRDLDERVARGCFREDLRNLLDPTRLHIPPLRDRPEDITWHIDRCLEEFKGITIGSIRGISEAAETEALEHDWPRNVAELRLRMERAMALALDEWITPIDLFPERGFGSWRGQPNVTSLAEARHEAERRQIERGLALHDGQIAKAAKTLGISRTTLWEKMKRLGLGTDETS